MSLQEELLRVWDKHKITVMFVTHSVEEAVFLADRVAVLTPGPGRVREIVDISIPRDARNWDTINSNENFVALRDHVMKLVQDALPAGPDVAIYLPFEPERFHLEKLQDVGRFLGWQGDHAVIELIRKGILPEYIVDSFGRYTSGVLIGLALGLTFGLLIGLSRFWSKILGPIINFFYAIVEVSWIPLLVIWIGYGFSTILIAIGYVVFFPVFYNTLTGVRTVQPVLRDAMLMLGASRKDVLFNVILPSALPNIITGFRVGAGFAFRGLIFAEMIAAGSGIGFMIFDAATTRQTDRVIVGMIVMGVLWLLLDRLLLRPIEKATVERWGLVRSQGGEN